MSRYRITKEPDGAHGLYDLKLDLKIGHYYRSRRFVERVVAVYRDYPSLSAVDVYNLADAEKGKSA